MLVFDFRDEVGLVVAVIGGGPVAVGRASQIAVAVVAVVGLHIARLHLRQVPQLVIGVQIGQVRLAAGGDGEALADATRSIGHGLGGVGQLFLDESANIVIGIVGGLTVRSSGAALPGLGKGDKGTTMTVSVTQGQMRQNVFHHTLTVSNLVLTPFLPKIVNPFLQQCNKNKGNLGQKCASIDLINVRNIFN